MLRPLHTTLAYKGFRLPATRWTGDRDVVARTEELCSHVSMARDAHNMRDRADRERSFVAYVNAAAALQAFCLKMDLWTKEAERAIFTARLQADVTAGELDTVWRAKNANEWVEVELTEIWASGEGANKICSSNCKDHVD